MSRLSSRLSSPNIIAYFEKNCLISTKYDMIVLLSPKLQHFGAFAKLRSQLLATSCLLPVGLSSCNNSAPTGQIFMEFYIWEFFENTGFFISPRNMLENWLMPQLNEDSNDYIFQQDGSPANYKDVRGYLNRNLSQWWIGRTRKDDALMRWPPRSPDLTPCDFFFWGFV